MNVGQALSDPTTVLGRAAAAQRERQEQMKDWTPAQREAYWKAVAEARR